MYYIILLFIFILRIKQTKKSKLFSVGYIEIKSCIDVPAAQFPLADPLFVAHSELVRHVLEAKHKSNYTLNYKS